MSSGDLVKICQKIYFAIDLLSDDINEEIVNETIDILNSVIKDLDKFNFWVYDRERRKNVFIRR